MNNTVYEDNLSIHLLGVEVGRVQVCVRERAKLQYPLQGYNDILLLATAEFNSKKYKIASIEGGVNCIITELKQKIEKDLTYRKSRKSIFRTINKLTGEVSNN